jgi:hypothetical protein
VSRLKHVASSLTWFNITIWGEYVMTKRQLDPMSQRYFGLPPKFDPEKGQTVFEPEGAGHGYWAGGHSVILDPDEEKSYIDKPWVRSSYGCIRYMDALIVRNEIRYYHEWTREDGSHELRMNKVSL